MTARGADEDLLDQLVAQGGWPVMLIRLELDEGPLHIGWGFIGRVIDDFTETTPREYIGVGELGEIQFAEERMNAFAQSVMYTLSGIDPSTATDIPGFRDALGDSLEIDVRGRPVKLYIASLTRSMGLVGEPCQLRSDLAASLTLVDGGDTLKMSLKASPKSFDYRRHRSRLYARADWRALHPGSSLMDDDTWRRRQSPWGKRALE